MSRLLDNLQNRDYSKVFANTITNSVVDGVLHYMYGELKNIIRGQYDTYCYSADEKSTLVRIKKQYTVSTDIYSVFMEDYFFIFLMNNRKYGNSKTVARAVYDGMCFIFLDAIYNNGGIQKLAEEINPSKRNKLHALFSSFDNIFTVNYDCNLDKFYDRQMYHLHGDFNTLYDQYDLNAYVGRAFEIWGKYELPIEEFWA